MKDYIPFKQNNSDSTQPAKTRKTVSDLPFFLRYFFLFCALFLFLKLFFHLPAYLSSPPDTIRINGNQILSEDTVLKYLNLDAEKPWFSLDPYELSVQLRNHPWIERALVHRTPPFTVDVNVTERVPTAFLKTADNLFLLGKDYLVLKRLHLSSSWDLPIIVNHKLKKINQGERLQPRDLKRAFQLISLLKIDKTLPLDAVSEIIVTDPFNIIIISSPDGIRIKFGFENFERKLDSLARLMPQIYKNLKRIEYIDLRSIRGATIKYKKS